MAPDVLDLGDAARQEDAVLDYIRAELARVDAAPDGSPLAPFVVAALAGVPWVGGFIAAAAAARSQNQSLRADSLQTLWLNQHEEKLRRLQEVLDDMSARFTSLGDEVGKRIRSEEFLGLVREGFGIWDRAETNVSLPRFPGVFGCRRHHAASVSAVGLLS